MLLSEFPASRKFCYASFTIILSNQLISTAPVSISLQRKQKEGFLEKGDIKIMRKEVEKNEADSWMNDEDLGGSKLCHIFLLIYL